MQIPIISGIYADKTPDFRTAYPRNLVPVPKQQGISNGYLKPADGLVEFGTGPGIDRGGVNWNGFCYRVMGNALIRVESSGSVTVIGSIGGDGQVTFDYSFDRLAIAASGALYYWNGITLTLVTDPDLGRVIDFVWVDGYFMTTDGEALVVTELNDPAAVNPLKYGSSEADPDKVQGLLKLRNEPYALNRYTIEVFDNVGGSLFPFQRIEGAQIQKGVIGTFAACIFTEGNLEGIAFLGSGRNEPPSIYFGVNGQVKKLASREIDTIIQNYSETDLKKVVVESRNDKGHKHLLIHLPDQTIVYDSQASLELQMPVWFILSSAIVGNGKYRARNLVWCYDRWIFGDPTTNKIGVFSNEVSSHFEEINGWEFGTAIVYNEMNGCIFHELELCVLSGRIKSENNPVVWTSYSTDGETWSVERPRHAGAKGNRTVRLNWLQQGNMRNWRIQKFRGTSDAHIAVARLDARIEGLTT